MTLSQRLITGSLLVIGAFVVLTVVTLDRRLRTRLREDITGELAAEARVVGSAWRAGVDADSLADSAGAAIGHRVTLIDHAGVVVGDADFNPPALGLLQNHAHRPEVMTALAADTGSAVRLSPSTGEEQLYAAVRVPMGVARISVSTRSQEELVGRMRRDVLVVALAGTIVAMLLAALFARSVTRPILELRDDARAIAAGDLARRPSLAASGEVGELAAAFHRLAEQLGARLKALEADDALLRALTESLNEGVVALDARETVLLMNAQARRLLGVRDEVPFPADHLPRDRVLRDALVAALAGRATEALELELQDRSLALTARPLAAGGAVVALFDLTPVRRLEAVRRDFVANVSHELKTPLTVVRGFAETLGDEHLPAEQRAQFTAAILGNTRRMQRIVDDLLDLSRIESGSWTPRPAPVDVAALAADVIAARAASAEGPTLRSDVGAGAETLVADPTAVRQILDNLVDNAIRHTARGEVVVFASRRDGGIAFGVRDTGSGIPAEHLSRIFERFYRIDAARARGGGDRTRPRHRQAPRRGARRPRPRGERARPGDDHRSLDSGRRRSIARRHAVGRGRRPRAAAARAVAARAVAARAVATRAVAAAHPRSRDPRVTRGALPRDRDGRGFRGLRHAAVSPRHRITLTSRAGTATLAVARILSCRLAWRSVELMDALDAEVGVLRLDLSRVYVFDASALRFLVIAAHTWALFRDASLDVTLPVPDEGQRGPDRMVPAVPGRDSFVAVLWGDGDATEAPSDDSVTQPSRDIPEPQPVHP